jgi:hypothetical protein
LVAALAFVAVGSTVAFGTSLSPAGLGGGPFNTKGNMLISDQFNNRAVEIDPSTSQVVWSFGSNNPALCNPGPGAIIGTNWVERLSEGLTILAGTGTPPGASPAMPNGCVDNRVIVVDQSGNIVWQYGQAGVTGSGSNQLNVPVSAIQLPNHDFLITDQGNERVIEVTKSGKVIWQYGMTGVIGSGFNQLNNPNSAELLTNGDILIADENNSRAIEVNRAHQIVQQFRHGLNIVAFASRLPNGNTLITDSGNSRIVEVNQTKQVVFQYFTNTVAGSNSAPLPTNAVRLANGNTEIADQFNNRAIIVDPNGNLVVQYGVTNVSGNTTGFLNAPYTSFTIGDYTGQTPPPPRF